MAGLYVSYPFCAQKCTYCNFASGVFPPDLRARYLRALFAEIEQERGWGEFETVYLGGGTPGSMDTAVLTDLLGRLPGGPWAEATLETAPGAITAGQVKAWGRAGINRVSLGVQSFVRHEIALAGRKHTAEACAGDIGTLRAGGLDNFNIDLIAGLAGQSMASWQESLDWIERLGPPHVSVYMLEVDQDSRLGRELLAGGARYGAGEAPSEELIADLYEIAVERLASMGLARYEISNFARPGRQSRHNLKYWRLEPYAGFGADAHSFDGAVRWRNAESPADFVARFEAGQPFRVESTAANPAEEKFFVGLRLSEGIRASREEWQRYEKPIRRFLDDGLLDSRGDTLRLTSRGVLLSNEVFQEFLNT